MWRKKLNDTLAHIIGRGTRENRFDQDPDLKDQEIIKKRKNQATAQVENESHISLFNQPSMEEKIERFGQLKPIPEQFKKEATIQDNSEVDKTDKADKAEVRIRKVKNKQLNRIIEREKESNQIEDAHNHEHAIPFKRRVPKTVGSEEQTKNEIQIKAQQLIQAKIINNPYAQEKLEINEQKQNKIHKQQFQVPSIISQDCAQQQKNGIEEDSFIYEMPIQQVQSDESQNEQQGQKEQAKQQRSQIQSRRQPVNPDYLYQLPLSAHSDSSQPSESRKSSRQEEKMEKSEIKSNHLLEYSQAILLGSSFTKLQSLSQLKQKDSKKQNTIPDEVMVKTNSNAWLVLKVLFICILIGAISSLLVMNSCMFFNVGQCTSQTKSIFPPLIVNRNFQENQCFVVNYSKITSTTVGSNVSLTRTNETLYYCIREITENQDLNLVGYYKHVSSQDLSVSPPKVNYYDTSIMLESPLLYPSNASSSSTNGSSFNVNNPNPNITINSSMEEQIIDHFVIFQFTISRNGTLLNLIFNSRNQNATVGQLPKLIKLFFPKIDLSLYLPSARLLQLQDDDQIDRLLQSNSSNNSTDNASNTQIGYGYSNNNGGAQLTNSLNQGPSLNDPIFASHAMASQSSFGSDGQLNQGGMQGQSTINTPEIPPSSTHQVFNMPMEINLQQNVSMSLVTTMDNLTHEAIAQFYAFFYIYSVQTNKTLNFTEDELSAYLMDQGGSTSRRRLQTQSPNSVFLKQHKFMLLQTSALGMSLVVEGCVYVEFDLTQLSRYKYQPQFKTGADIFFSLGPFNLNYPIFSYDREFDPLSLGVTLDRIKNLISFFSDDFLQLVETISSLKSITSFDTFFLDEMNLMLIEISNAISLIDQEQQLLIPANFLSIILGNLGEIITQAESLGSGAILVNLDIIQTLKGNLYLFSNATYDQNLLIFKLVQQAFNGNALIATNLLQGFVSNSSSILHQYSGYISNILKGQLQNLYQEELKKAEPFFNLYKYIKNATKDVNINLTTALRAFQSNYQAASIDMMDQFYSENLNNFEEIVAFSQERQAILNASMDQVSALLRQSQIKVDGYLNSTIFDIYKLSTLTQSNIGSVLSSFTSMLAFFDQYAGYLQNDLPSGCGSWGGWYWQNSGACFNQAFRDAANSAATISSTIGMFRANTSLLSYQLNQLSLFLTNADKILKGNGTIDQLYTSLQNEILSISSFYPQVLLMQNSFTGLHTIFIGLYNGIANNICCSDCCQINFINSGLNELNAMIEKIQSFNTQWANFINLQAFKNYTDTIQLFSKNDYSSAKTYFIMYRHTENFFNQETLVISRFSAIFQSIKQTKQNIKPDYLLGKKVSHLIQASFNYIRDYTDKFCSVNNTKADEITTLQSHYSTSITTINAYLPNSLLQNAFDPLILAYQDISLRLFDQYTPLGMCDPTIHSLVEYTTNASQDASNFLYIQKIANSLLPMISQGLQMITSIDKQISLFDGKIYRIYNLPMFNDFINAETNFVAQTKQYMQEFGLNISNIKDSMKNLHKFTTINPAKIFDIIQIFNQTNLNINYISLYSQSESLLKATLEALQKLNFQVFFTYISIASQVSSLMDDLQTITTEAGTIRQLTADLTREFVNLGGGVTQQFLKAINSQYISLDGLIPTKIYQQLVDRVESYDQYFQNIIQTFYQYQRNYTQQRRLELMRPYNMSNPILFNLIMGSLTFYTQVNQVKEEIVSTTGQQFAEVIRANSELISSIKIGYLNTIIEMGVYIYDQYIAYRTFFNNEISTIKDLASKIKDNYFFIIGTAAEIIHAKDTLTGNLDSTLTNITLKVKQLLAIIEEDRQIYEALSKTAFFNQLKQIRVVVNIDFGAIWSKFQPLIDKIAEIQSKISPEVIQLLSTFIDLKQNLSSISTALQNKIEQIKRSFTSVDFFLNQLKQILFKVLQKELSRQVKEKLMFAKDLIRKITGQDLVFVNDICQTTLPPDQMAITLSLKLVNTLRSKISLGSGPLVIQHLEDQIVKVVRFLSNSLVQKFGFLREGQCILNAVTTSQDPTSKIVLFDYSLISKEILIVKIQFCIATPIGIFIFSFMVDFTFDCDIVISLVNLRSVNIGINVHPALSLEANFGYGIPAIIEVGMYIRGTLLEIAVEPGFQLQNIIPLQLIPAISQIAQLKGDNAFALNFYMDIQINTCIFEVGGYVSHIGIQIYWIRISFCISIKFWFIRIHFCIEFDFPIIIPIWQTHKYGKRFDGIALLKKRLFSLTIFRLQLQ